MPRAARLIREASFRPEVVHMLGNVLEDEWAEIKGEFDGWRQPAIDAARASLARVTLHLAGKGITDPKVLRTKVHNVMQRSHAALADRQSFC